MEQQINRYFEAFNWSLTNKKIKIIKYTLVKSVIVTKMWWKIVDNLNWCNFVKENYIRWPLKDWMILNKNNFYKHMFL